MFRIILFSLFLVLLTACNGGGGGGSEDDDTTTPPIADLDNDGIADDVDTDIDGDTYLNDDDEFPRDASEWWDTDLDLIGDNTDPDIDGDDIPNELDSDKDGDDFPNDQDIFPANPNEWIDTDSDGVGDNADPDIDGDGILNEDDSNSTGQAVSVEITSPASLLTVGVSPVEITGTIDHPDAVLTVNGISVSHINGEYIAQVSLDEGHNTIEARAVLDEQTVTDVISVSLDATPPYITIESHQDGDTVYESEVVVTGLINDIVRGTIEQEQSNITINGVDAIIVNRSYSGTVSLSTGVNQIIVSGSDQVGNTNSETISLEYTVPVGRSISVTSGKNQSAKINTQLTDSLEITVLDQDNNPVEGETVVFRVVQGSGYVGAGSDKEGRAIVTETDADGLASTDFIVGTRVGTANHKVRAAVVGYENQVVINASATGGTGDKISINSGNNQRGSIGQVLPEALVVAVTDAGANVVEGARVEFKTSIGDGTFTNNLKTYETQTDSDGRATAEFVLGSLTGIDAQRINATLLDGPEDQTIIAGFMATAFKPLAAGDTKISGVILDNLDIPIPGVTVRIEGSNRQDISDEQGQFKITEAPIGPVHLIADGSTATSEGEFPSLSYNLVTISGVDNPLSAPIYMVAIDTDGAVYAGLEDVVLALDSYPGFKLEIEKGSVTFPDGSKEGLISATPVNASKVPMAPPNGMQPQFIVTIQPTGATFDPPARLTLPNVDAHPVGAQAEMYSYDHDLEEFVSIGLGTVSEDGSIIASNQGVGVIKAGWHCGSQPAGSGCCQNGKDCGHCYDTTEGCPADCNLVPSRVAENQIEGNCQRELCSGSTPNNSDQPPAECGTCKNGAPDVDETQPLNDQKPDDCKELLCGGGFNPKNETSEVQKVAANQCKVCESGDLANAADEKTCGDNSTKQQCYTCKDGKCGNHCDASQIKNKFENTAPSFVLNALTSFPDALDASPIFTAELAPFIDMSLETGEQCCKNCETPGPKSYNKYTGAAGIKGTVQATIPNLGIAHKFPKKPTSFIGFSVKGRIFITAAGATIEVDAKGEASYLDIDCPGEDCGDFFLGSTFSALIGPQVDLSVALVDCTDPDCKESTTITAVTGKGSIALTVKGSIGLKRVSGAQCGSDCLGFTLDPITGAAKGSISFELLFKKWTLSGSTDPVEFYAGGSWGAGCS